MTSVRNGVCALAVSVVFSTLLLIVKGNESHLCPSRGVTFPSPEKDAFYYCEKQGASAVLKRCLENHVYLEMTRECHPLPEKELHIKSQIRVRRSKIQQTATVRSEEGEITEEESGSMTSPVLGRVVFLGDLYDLKHDEIWVGESLWKPERINSTKIRSIIPSSHTEFAAADTLNDRLAKMDISASLKLAFMSGLIEVEGSGGYLRDSKESENVVSAMMSYRATTHSETIPSNMMVTDFTDACESGATHVVTSLTYGMDANFIFNKKVSNNESAEEIRGALKVAIKAIPQFEISGEATVEIKGEQKKRTENIDVKIHGDFLLPKQPNTYEEAIEVYQALPTYLGDAPEFKKAAKIQMRLSPIESFCTGSTQTLKKLKSDILNEVSMIVGKIEQTILAIKTLSHSGPAMRYQDVNDALSEFYKSIKLYDLKVKRDLRRLLPMIRAGVEGATSGLQTLQRNYQSSKFSKTNSASFLDHRRREIQMLQHMIEDIIYNSKPNILLLDETKGTVVKEILSKPKVLILTYNVLPDPDITKNFLNDEEVDERKAWFNVDTTVASLGEAFYKLKAFAAANRDDEHGFIVSLERQKSTGTYSEVFAQANNVVVGSFAIPSAPKASLGDVTQESVTITCEPKELSDGLRGCRVTYSKVFEGTGDSEKNKNSTVDTYGSEELEKCVISGLEANTDYRFFSQYITDVGLSPRSKEILVRTRPCSPPSQLKFTTLTSDDLVLTWGEPFYIPPQITVKQYVISVIQNKGSQTGKKIGKTSPPSSSSITFDGLEPATSYTVKVQAKVDITKRESRGIDMAVTVRENTEVLTTPESPTSTSSLTSDYAVLEITTLPNPPATPKYRLRRRNSDNQATLFWTHGTTAVGADITGYRLRYYRMDSNGRTQTEGTELGHDVAKRFTRMKITNLLAGSTYGASIKMKTTYGDSIYSPPVIFKVPLHVSGSLATSTQEDILTGVVNPEVQGKEQEIKTEIGKITTIVEELVAMNAEVDTITQGQTRNTEAVDDLVTKFGEAYIQWEDHGDARELFKQNIQHNSEDKRSYIKSEFTGDYDDENIKIKSYIADAKAQLLEAKTRADLVPSWLALGVGETTIDGYNHIELRIANNNPYTCATICKTSGKLQYQPTEYYSCFCVTANGRFIVRQPHTEHSSSQTYFVKYTDSPDLVF